MKSSDVIEELTKPPTVCPDGLCGEAEEEDDDEIEYEDEDFLEAIDLLETARKSIQRVLKYEEVGEGRRRVLNNLCDDIGQFLAYFVEVPEETK